MYTVHLSGVGGAGNITFWSESHRPLLHQVALGKSVSLEQHRLPSSISTIGIKILTSLQGIV